MTPAHSAKGAPAFFHLEPVHHGGAEGWECPGVGGGCVVTRRTDPPPPLSRQVGRSSPPGPQQHLPYVTTLSHTVPPGHGGLFSFSKDAVNWPSVCIVESYTAHGEHR